MILESDSEFQAKFNINFLNRINLIQMTHENEELLRTNKSKIRTVYIDTGRDRENNDGFNQYGIECTDVVTSLMSDNEILVKRINKIKLQIQVLKKEHKVFNKSKTQKELYLSAFLAASELILSTQQFTEIENTALKLMQYKV